MITLDFTIDGAGLVTLDAQSSNGGAAPQAVVNAWDGSVGTVTDAGLFNTSFTLIGVAKENGVQIDQLSTDADTWGSGLHVSGLRVNNAGTEEIAWTYSGVSALTFESVAYTNRAADGDSNLTLLDADSRTEFMLPGISTGGSIDLSGQGFSLVSGQSFIVTTDDLKDDGITPRSAAAGAALYGFTISLDAPSVSLPVPVQHLDATEASSVTVNGSGEVSAWVDQSGNGNDAVDSNGAPVLYPSSSLSPTDLPGLDVRPAQATLQLFDASGQDAVLDFTGSASGNSGFAVLVAFHADDVFMDNTRNIVIGNYAAVSDGFQMRFDRGTMAAYLDGTALVKSAESKVEIDDAVVYGFNYTASSGNAVFWDSKNNTELSKVVTSADFSTGNPLRLAGSNNGSQYMDGFIGEVRVFDQALSGAEFALVRQEMEDTWLTVTNIPAPRNLSATADDEWVELDWKDDKSGDLFAGYTVYRSTESGTNYVEMASGLTDSDYLDIGMPGGITYYYVVTSVDTNGVESPFSNEIAIVPNEVIRLQHLDATKMASVLLSGNAVTQWVDQALAGNDAFPMSGTVFYPSVSFSESGLAGLDMQAGHHNLELFSAAGSDIWLNQSTGTNGFCVMVALKCDAVNPGITNDIIGNSTDGMSGFGVGYSSSGALSAWLGGTVIASAPNAVQDGETLILAFNYDAQTGNCDFWDSKNYSVAVTNVPKSDFSTASAVTIGSAAAAGRYFNGMVGEVKVFGSSLSPDNFERERVALLNKWTDKPNIIMFFVDDWAWSASSIPMDERMANSMNQLVETPNLETLAGQGMRFRNAYGSVMCVPSRASLLTGQSSARHQFTVEYSVTDYYDARAEYAEFPVIPNGVRKPLPENLVSIPEALRPLGYRSAHYGKWHLDSDPGSEGYEEHDGNVNNNPGTTLEDVTVIPPDFTNPKRMHGITDRTLAFMEKQQQAGHPFYVQLSHYAQHEPRECLPASRARYQDHPHVVAYNNGKTDPEEISARGDPAVWLGMMYDLDQTLGQLLQKVEDMGIADNTYIIVMSDNGYRHEWIMEDQPLHARKWWSWQGGVRVPMVVRGPEIAADSLCTANVVNYDLLPTFMEWAGGDPARLQNIDGVSIAGLMKGDTPTEEFLSRSLYFHYPHWRTSQPHSSIIKGQHKVVYFYETPVAYPGWEPIMLFDLANDPGEYHNIQPQESALADALYADLTNHLAETGARIPLDNSASYNPTAFQAAPEYAVRVKWGPFIGTRTPETDESATIHDFSDYWMESWGVNLGDETNDYDGDGVLNLMEYATGGDPTDHTDTGSEPKFKLDGGAADYSYKERNDDSALNYTVESTTNLVSGEWTTTVPVSSFTNAADPEFNEIFLHVPILNEGSFYRLRVVK